MNKLNIDLYYIPASPVDAEIKVKGSKFIAGVIPVKSKNEAEQAYNEIKKKNYDATHNCFAYRIDANIFRYSDDGEPNGTAGKPILQMIDSKNLSETLCVVTRYFGGTKLGTGGLIRAYSDAAKEALGKVKILNKVRSKKIRLLLNYDLENNVRNLLNSYQGRIDSSDYTDHIEMDLLIPESKTIKFKDEIIELSNNTIKIKFL
ncbi:MAG: YigZ family protein [Calditrichaceae bacterium]|nr:YigZ family protein [Calditrichaceae bacterium]